MLIFLFMNQEELYLLSALGEHLRNLQEARIELLTFTTATCAPAEQRRGRFVESDLYLPYLEKAMMSSSETAVPAFRLDETDETASREWTGEAEGGALRAARTKNVLRAFNMDMTGVLPGNVIGVIQDK